MAYNDEIARKLKEIQTLIGETTEDRKTIETLWTAWALGMSQTKSEGTVSSINSAWKRIQPYAGHLYLQDITNIWWTTVFIPGIRSTRHMGFKFANCRKWLSMLLKSIEDNGLAPSGYKRPRFTDPDGETREGQVYTDEEISRLLACAGSDLRLQILMAVTMAMRKSEILLLKLDRINADKKIIRLRAEDTKIRKGRSFGISSEVWTLIEPRLNHTSGFLFPNHDGTKSVRRGGNSSAWKTAKRKAGIKGKTFHDLRRTALTKMFKTNTNPALICAAAGLGIEMAQRVYLRFSDDDLQPIAHLVKINAK